MTTPSWAKSTAGTHTASVSMQKRLMRRISLFLLLAHLVSRPERPIMRHLPQRGVA